MTLKELYEQWRAFEAEHGVRAKRATFNAVAWQALRDELSRYRVVQIMEPIGGLRAEQAIPIVGFERLELAEQQTEPIVCHRE